MILSIGDKVRVHFYLPNTTYSFVEGIVDRNEIYTFRGRSFSIQTTRQVVLGHEISSPRSLPYIIAYEKEDDFEGRIEVLEPAGQSVAEPEPEMASGTDADHALQTESVEIAEEFDSPQDTQVDATVEPEPQKRSWGWLFKRAA